MKTWTPIPLDHRYDEIPADTGSPVWFGILVHLGGIFASVPILHTIGLSLGSVLLVMGTASGLTLAVSLVASAVWPKATLPAMERRTMLRHFLWDILGKGLCVGGAVVAVGCWAVSWVSPHEVLSAGWGRMLLAVALCDLWYFSLHRWLMHGRGREATTRRFRREHGIHHRVTALDFFRGNQGSLIDNGVVSFPLPLILCSLVLGLSPGAVAWVYLVLMLVQVTHHVNHTFDIGVLRYVVLDSHAHKMHHCSRGQLVNFAAVFSVWDRLLGSYYENYDLSPSHLHTARLPAPIRGAPAVAPARPAAVMGATLGT